MWAPRESRFIQISIHFVASLVPGPSLNPVFLLNGLNSLLLPPPPRRSVNERIRARRSHQSFFSVILGLSGFLSNAHFVFRPAAYIIKTQASKSWHRFRKLGSHFSDRSRAAAAVLSYIASRGERWGVEHCCFGLTDWTRRADAERLGEGRYDVGRARSTSFRDAS